MTVRAEPAGDAALERLLEYLRLSRGFDFTAYKRSTLTRRILKRMEAAAVEGFDAYADYLAGHPEEFDPLFNTILINVTSFFRDAEVWDAMRDTVIPRLLTARPTGHIRVWSAGCASGQEAYSVVMLVAEALGVEATRERLKLYATDADEEALAEARRALYPPAAVEDIPAPLLERYFERGSDGYTFHRELRRCVIFGRHDLIQDPPISQVDVLLCRNTLMYFNADVQSRIMARFHFSVRTAGFLVLGRAEMLFSYAGMFQPVDLKRRIFTAVPKSHLRDRLLLLGNAVRKVKMTSNPLDARLREAAFDTAAQPQIIVDAGGALAAANSAARRQFKLGDADLGTPLQNLELSYRPAEIRQSLDEVRRERREVTLAGVPWAEGAQTRYVDVTLTPLTAGDTLLGTRVTFNDVTPVRALQDELLRSKHDLETAYEELQSTNEELETTNEELQSTVEELETTNEELQSTNEELETMNEELQSTNEELQTMNDELRSRSTDLNSSNAFLESVFTSLGTSVVVLDRDLRVDVWNAGATELWGLRPEEVKGAHFFNLDFGLPVAELHQPIREVLHGGPAAEVTVAATNRKGRALRCRVRVSPLRAPDASATGAILLMEQADDRGDA